MDGVKAGSQRQIAAVLCEYAHALKEGNASKADGIYEANLDLRGTLKSIKEFHASDSERFAAYL